MQLRVGGSVFALVVATARATGESIGQSPCFTSRTRPGLWAVRARCYEVKTTAIRMRYERGASSAVVAQACKQGGFGETRLNRH